MFGPPMYVSLLVALAMLAAMAYVVVYKWRANKRNIQKVQDQEQAGEKLRELKHAASLRSLVDVDPSKAEKGTSVVSLTEASAPASSRRDYYNTNFV
ncbi:hypothetical protein PR003_g25281 [Phytophthora rubi]|uniref:Uncharacterized protein n=1 Tax=Phytophthora rubi TaxID=129364 RepID=A0A6A3IFA2_9STRA|nr:hypothetical protein PR002_g24515 [Phytophthora rubi]KAE8980868.1 hypothetical protein PR001_g24173 [Phytophthora rubi]KAE9290464.1 hypothetical protein PR003_g25281 [Phytophthora rubi]